MTPILLLNASAGTAAQLATRDLVSRMSQALASAGLSAEVRQVPPRGLREALMRARRADRPIVIAGGDGSVATAIQVLAGTGIPLGVIPLGTYNLLARDLGMPMDVEEAAGRLAAARPVDIDLGRVDLGRLGHRYFHTLAGFGFFARVARERALLRRRLPGGKIVAAVAAAVRSLTASHNLEVEIDDGRDRQVFHSPAVLVTNNLVEGATWRRPSLSAGLLEVTVARGDVPFPLLKGGWAAVLGSWRQSPDIVSRCAPRLTLTFPRARVSMSLDGEVLRARTPLRFEVVPRVLTVLAAHDGPLASPPG